MPKFSKTQTEAARELKISRATFIVCAAEPGFPAETARGWNLVAIDKWLQVNGRGPYRRGSGGETTTGDDGLTLTEAKIRLTREQAENERIEKERQLVEQAKELGEIVQIDDVRKLYLQTIATVTAVNDSLRDAVDRALPDSCPSADAWPDIKVRVLAMCQKLQADTSAAMEELDG